jgi:transcriptional regulator with XRE-family HTH domain
MDQREKQHKRILDNKEAIGKSLAEKMQQRGITVRELRKLLGKNGNLASVVQIEKLLSGRGRIEVDTLLLALDSVGLELYPKEHESW